MEVMPSMTKISDVLTVISFILFIALKMFDKNGLNLASLLCGVIFICKGCGFIGKGVWFKNIFQKEETKIS